MKKSKLFGSRLVENVFNPKTPRVIMFSDSDSITRQVFEEGDILDANSIRKILLKGGFSSGWSIVAVVVIHLQLIMLILKHR